MPGGVVQETSAGLRRTRFPDLRHAGRQPLAAAADSGGGNAQHHRSAPSPWRARSGSSPIRYAPTWQLRPGAPYSREAGDQALKDLYATELFANVTVVDRGDGNIVIQVRENPVINRIVLEGNKRIKDEKIRPEIKLAPRQIFTRSKVRADVARIIELYRRQGPLCRHGGTADGAAGPEPGRYRLRDQRGRQIQDPAHQHHRQSRNSTPRSLRSEMVTKETRAHAHLLVGHELRSRSAGVRSAEAAAILSDAGLCRFPRRLRRGGADARQEATSSSPTWWKKAIATSSATSIWKATSAT